MSAYTFKILVNGTDKLWSVDFYPEADRDFNINWNRQDGFKKYSTDELTIEIGDDSELDFELIIGARNTIKYTYKIKVKEGEEWKEIKSETRTIKKKNKDKLVDSVKIPKEIKPEPPVT